MIDTIKLFSYGTLQEKKIQIKIFGRELAGDRDTLPNFVLSNTIIDGEPFFFAEPSLGGVIEGRVFELSYKELIKADEYEGLDYKRVRVRLESGVEAWVYVRA